nr:hypothetical protein [Tanacetum cinerariifolium]
MDNSFTLGSTKEAENVKILQSCNGLLLCSATRPKMQFVTGGGLFDETTRVVQVDPVLGMVTFEALDELMEITSSTELHKRMRFWFVQEIAEEEGLLKFLRERYDDLRRKITKRRVLIREMEALEDRGVLVDSLESLKQTHAREN